ncbi:GntR family transcriptional regulator [Micromonospora parva]|uniref:GntR family transcriptional regulator n=1 Tax=Micromonospora parva TaxID=1464048 RepID=UPI0033D96A53
MRWSRPRPLSRQTSIRARTLQPGDKLPSIAEMREQYQSSAWPVRYALRILEERGWIVPTGQGVVRGPGTARLTSVSPSADLDPLAFQETVASGSRGHREFLQPEWILRWP